jgi:hypothetical protein
VLLVLLVVVGCGGAPGTVRSVEAQKWLRFQTEHFELSTDLPEEDARRAAEALERTRAAVLAAAWSNVGAGRLTSRTAVVVFRNGLDYEHFVGKYVLGHYTNTGRSTIFLYGPPERWEKRNTLRDDSTTSVLRHELVHRLAAGVYAREPRWFAEGLAQFLETIAVSEDGATAIIGRENWIALRNYQRVSHVGVADAFAWRSDRGKDDGTVLRLYGVSWLLVHWLYFTRAEAFAAYQVELAKGTDPAIAWSKSFGDLRPEDIDKQLEHHSRHFVFKEVVVSLPPAKAGMLERKTITEADVYAIRAQLGLFDLRSRTETQMAEVRGELERALSLEPGNVLALRLIRYAGMKMDNEDVLARLRKQVAERPDDGGTWLLLGERLGDDPAHETERIAALKRAVALSPNEANAYNALAWALVTTKHGEESLPLATKAAMLAPWNPAILDTYAAALFAVGRCPDALQMQKRAVDMIAEQDEAIREYETKLSEYARACGDAVSR